MVFPKTLFSQLTLHFIEFDNLTDGIWDRFQQPDILVYKNIQDVFVKLRNWNNYDE